MNNLFIFSILLNLFLYYPSKGQNCSIPKQLSKEIESATTNNNLIEGDFYRVNKLLFDLEFKNELSTLIHCESYKKNIRKLLNSDNEIKRVLAYRLIGSARDSTFNEKLIERIKSDETTLLKTWSSTALMLTKCAAASDELFQLFSSYPKGLPVDVLINMYVQYDSFSVKKTCWKYMDTENRNQQIMSIQCLASFQHDYALQKKLILFLETWDIKSKGWVISSMSIQKMGNLKPLLEKYGDNENLKNIIVEALKNSPTQADNEYAQELEK